MENELMHKRRRRKRGGAGLRKARCVVRCRAKGRGKRKTLTQCRRKCHVKGH